MKKVKKGFKILGLSIMGVLDFLVTTLLVLFGMAIVGTIIVLLTPVFFANLSYKCAKRNVESVGFSY